MGILSDIASLLDTVFTLEALLATLWAITVAVLSVLSGLFVTQFFKFMMPKIWSHRNKTMAARSVSMFVSFVVAVILMPTALGAVLGLIAALAAPWSYRLIVGLLYQRWPFLEKLLSMES